MATTGAKYPTAASSTAEAPWSANAWTTPANLYGAGTTSITAATYDAGDQSEILRAYTFDFSAIPDGSTIDGVQVVIGGAYYATAICALSMAQLLDTGGARVGTNQYSTPVNLTTSGSNYTKGGSTDKWGNSLTAAWVKNSNFGVGIGTTVGASNNCDVFIDSVTMEVWYTPPLLDFVHQGSISGVGYAASTRTIEKVFGSAIVDEQTYDADVSFESGVPPLDFTYQGALSAVRTLVSERSTEHTLQGALAQTLTQSHRVSGNIALAPSANITDGDPTTFQLTPPATKATTDFVAGKISDETNPVAVTITSDNYTELEWSIQVSAGQDEVFELRVTDAGTPISTAVTPSVTIGQVDFTCQGAIAATQTLTSTRTVEKVYNGALAAVETLQATRAIERVWNSTLAQTDTWNSQLLRDKLFLGTIAATRTWASDRQVERVVQGTLSQQDYLSHTRTTEHLIDGTLRADQTWNSYCEFDVGLLNFMHTGTLSAAQTWASQRIREAVVLGSISSEMSLRTDKMFDRLIVGALSKGQTWSHERTKEALIQSMLSQTATLRGDRTVERVIMGALGDVETWSHLLSRERVVVSSLSAEESWQSIRGIYKIIQGGITAEQTWNSSGIYEGMGTLFGHLHADMSWGHTVSSTRTKLIHIGNISGSRTWIHSASAEHLVQGTLTAEQFFEQNRPFRYSWTKDGSVDTVWVNRDASSSAWTKRDVTSDGWNKRGPVT